MCVCMYVTVCVYACMYTCVYACMYVCVYVCLYVCSYHLLQGLPCNRRRLSEADITVKVTVTVTLL